MIQIKFKDLEKSELATGLVTERVESVIERFPDLKESKIQITLEMENSIVKPGPDVFTVKFHVVGGRYDKITVTKADSNLYVALASVIDLMLETLNRFGDRSRVRERNSARKMVQKLYEHKLD